MIPSKNRPAMLANITSDKNNPIIDAEFMRLPRIQIDQNCNIETFGSTKVAIFRKAGPASYLIVKSFRTDGASIPQIFRNVASKYKFTNAGIVHDYIYHTHKYSRLDCDKIFYYLAKNNTKIWTSTAWLAYRAVRAAGHKYYGDKPNADIR